MKLPAIATPLSDSPSPTLWGTQTLATQPNRARTHLSYPYRLAVRFSLLSSLCWNSVVAIAPDSRHREPLVRVASCLRTHPRPPPPPKRLHPPRRNRPHKPSPHLQPPPSSASSGALFPSKTPPRRGTTRRPRSRTRARRSFGLPMRMPLPSRYVPEALQAKLVFSADKPALYASIRQPEGTDVHHPSDELQPSASSPEPPPP